MQDTVSIKHYDKTHDIMYGEKMMTTEELRALLKAHLEETGESGNSLAKRLGIQQSTISKLSRGNTGIAFESAMKILNDMGYRVHPGQESAPHEVKALQEKIDLLSRVNTELREDKEVYKKLFVEYQNKISKLESERPSKKEHSKDQGIYTDPGVTPTATGTTAIEQNGG